MRRRAVVIALVSCLVAGCGAGSDGSSDPTARPSSPAGSATPTDDDPTRRPARPPRESAPGTEIVVAGSAFGPMLFDGDRQAIYLFDVETTDRPECYGDCAEAWPPVLTDGEPVDGEGVRPRLLGTTRRTDGSTQLTYGGHPLYYYAHEGPGEVKCHDVFLNGGTWYVVRPDGTAG